MTIKEHLATICVATRSGEGGGGNTRNGKKNRMVPSNPQRSSPLKSRRGRLNIHPQGKEWVIKDREKTRARCRKEQNTRLPALEVASEMGRKTSLSCGGKITLTGRGERWGVKTSSAGTRFPVQRTSGIKANTGARKCYFARRETDNRGRRHKCRSRHSINLHSEVTIVTARSGSRKE